MKSELNKTASEKTLVSWLLSSSSAPMPSVSMTIMLTPEPSSICPLTGAPQIQSPFVQGFTVGPTPNPFCCPRIIRFIRYDFPVRYNPTTDITAIGAGIAFIISNASPFTLYSILYIKHQNKYINQTLYFDNLYYSTKFKIKLRFIFINV
jgi:hypothetical protein